MGIINIGGAIMSGNLRRVMPIDSGIDEKGFILIRENSTSSWKIDGAGEPYFCEDEEILL